MVTTLARRLGFFALIVYGIGDILGAGIYALVGKVIGVAGSQAWLTFLLAALLAFITGLSYAEMTARYPVSAGAAAFVRRAFPGRFSATLTGLMVLASGLASAATVTVAFSAYLQELLPVPVPLAQILILAALSFLSFWGIRESSRVNFVFTLVETLGLLAVLGVGLCLLDQNPLPTFWKSAGSGQALATALSGVTVAFYAYMGFEDLANLAEECRRPSHDIPRAILISIAFTTFLYLAVTVTLLLHIPLASIAASSTPLLLVFEAAGLQWILKYFSIVAILAILNTGLINLITVSRLMYGMAQEGLVPKGLGYVHHHRRTPWVGVLIAFTATLLLVFTGGLKALAQTTSFFIMVVFLLVHLSLISVKNRKIPHGGIRVPIIFPILGVLLCLMMLLQFPWEIYVRSLVLIGIGLLLWAVQVKNTKTT